MTWMRLERLVVPAVAAVLGCALVTGCGAGGAAAPPAAGPSHAASPTPATTPGQVRLSGAVRQPATLSLAQLAAMPSQTVSVQFGTEQGSQRHTEVGVPLVSLIDAAGPLLTPGVKHDELSLGVLVVGSDGYRALLSYGELSASFGNSGALLATSQDGAPLSSPRLVLPRDVKGGRYVAGVVALQVVHPPTDR